MRAAYGDAAGHIFLVSAGIAVVGIAAAALLKPVTAVRCQDHDNERPEELS